MSHTAYKIGATVGPSGKVEITVPLPQGTPIEIVVLSSSDSDDELVDASTSSMNFWDNPQDDEDWNNA